MSENHIMGQENEKSLKMLVSSEHSVVSWFKQTKLLDVNYFIMFINLKIDSAINLLVHYHDEILMVLYFT